MKNTGQWFDRLTARERRWLAESPFNVKVSNNVAAIFLSPGQRRTKKGSGKPPKAR
jgi:hypothetical protein